MTDQLSLHIQTLLPQEEPRPSSGEFVYKVAEPYYTRESVFRVLEGLLDGEISSASKWPVQLGHRISDYLDLAVAFPTSSGFSALVVALIAGKVGQGDEVIIPAFTMVAVRNAVKFVGALPVYVDNESLSLNPSLDLFVSAISPRTKAVIVTHTYGAPVPGVEMLAKICGERNILLIEDIAESFGAIADSSDRKLGSFGDFVCGSLYANKNLTAGDGGFVGTKHPQISDHLKSVINHGFNPKFHFVHFFTAPNAKANGLGCALALGAIDTLDVIMERRRSLFRLYRAYLSSGIANGSLVLLEIFSPWVVPILVADKHVKREVRKSLAELYSIETRSFFFPLHLQPCVLKEDLTAELSLPRSVDIYERGLYLPLHPYLSEQDVSFICAAVIAILNEGSAAPECPRKPGWARDARRAELGDLTSVFRDL